jgi:hypothetical protein
MWVYPFLTLAVALSVAAQCTFEDPCNLSLETESNYQRVNTNEEVFFNISLTTSNDNFEVSSLANFGIVSLFITSGNPPRKPTTSDYEWSSLTSGESDVVTLCPCTMNSGDNTYMIMVRGVFESEFKLLVSSAALDAVINLGEPLRSTVQGGSYEYFVVNVSEFNGAKPTLLNNIYMLQIPASNTASSLTIVLTEYSGNPSMAISKTYSHPNSTSTCFNQPCWDYQSTRDPLPGTSLSADDYHVTFAVASNTAQTFYVGVTSDVVSTFSILAIPELPPELVTTSIITLLNGSPQNLYVTKGRWRYFNLRTGNNRKFIFFFHM